MASGGVVELSEGECWQRLENGIIGRVLLNVNALPTALPVNYRVLDGTIVFRSVNGSKLVVALERSIVGFEVDALDEMARTGWSVVAVGQARVITDPDELDRAAAAGIDTWVRQGAPAYIAIDVGLVSGRELGR